MENFPRPDNPQEFTPLALPEPALQVESCWALRYAILRSALPCYRAWYQSDEAFFLE